MRSSRRTEVSINSSAQQPTNQELTAAWKGLTQSKAALRHIENRLEAAPGTGVLLDSVMDPRKTFSGSSRKVSRRDGGRADEVGGSSKWRGRGHQSPEKSTSRSPLRNTTQDCNVRRSNNVEFREPLASYREATPPLTPSQLEAHSLQSVSYSSSLPTSETLLSQLVYQRDTRDRQTDRDLDSTHSLAPGSTEVRYLNDRLALDALRTTPRPVRGRALTGDGAGEEGKRKAQLPHGRDSQARIPPFTPATDPVDPAENSTSTSPGSASQRLENLRRRQPDDKLEKLKERIRRQREHLEEAAERDRLLGYLEQPILGAGTTTLPTATIRKVATAPPAPIYKGFNSSEMKIQTPDGKVWKEEEFHNFSREIYRDLSRQLTESTRPRQQQRDQSAAERSRERRPPKPVRKVHKATPGSDPDAKPAIGPSSWREGQKLVKMVLGPAPRLPREDQMVLGPAPRLPREDQMVLGPAPRLPREDQMHPADRLNKTDGPGDLHTLLHPGDIHRSSSDPRSESNQHSRPNSTERPRSRSRGRSNSHSAATPPSSAAAQAPVAPSTELLSADIQGILDDLHLECKRAEQEEERAGESSRGGDGSRRGRGGSGSRTRAPVSAWGCSSTAAGSSLRGSRSASPAKRQPEPGTVAETGQKKRHYDADTVRQYIARQQEERKRRQVEERKAQREEVERRNQRLQELYRKQRGGGGGGGAVAAAAKSVVLSLESPVGPVQKRLQETYTKLLLEEAQLGEEATQTQPDALPTVTTFQLQPMYQPSGESDKENKRLEAPQSPSSSDTSLSEQPPLSRNDLGVGVPSWLQPDHFLGPAVRPATATNGTMAPPGDHLLSQLLRLDTEAGSAAGGHRHTRHSTTPPSNRARSNMSRIEALKATAASLSNRLESEARKLAGEGFNCGLPTTMDVDAILAPQPSQTNRGDGHWAKAVSPPCRDTTTIAMMDNDDLALRIKRILSGAGQSSYDSAALPGVGNVHAPRGQKERNATPSALARPQASSAPVTGHNLSSHAQEGRKLVNGLERVERMKGLEQRRGYEGIEVRGERGLDGKTTDLHDSSGGSISEGPLSEGSLSDGEASPPHPSTNHIPRPADRLGAVDYCAGQRGSSYQPLSQFRREAEKYLALGSPFSQRDGNKAAWEELSKGSPHSVINIFTKNLQSHPKAADERPERSSPSIRSVQSGASPADAAAYEDDFVSSRSSGGSGQSKKGYNGRSPNIHYEELMRRSPYETRTGDYNSHHSSGSTSGSSPLSKGSTGKKGAASDRSDATLVEEQRSSEAVSTDSRRRGSERSSAHSQAKSAHSDGTLGGASDHSIRSLGLDSKRSPVGTPGLASPAGSPPGPGSPPGTDYPGMSEGSASLPGADGLNIGLGSGSSATAKGKPTAAHTTTTTASGRVESRTTAELQFAPGVLQQRMSAELNYLESIEESVRQLGDVERLRGVSMAQQESVSLAQILKAQQQRHERDLYELKIKAEREALETQLHLEESRQRAARAHAELQGSMVASQQKSLGGLQEATVKMMSQQAEAARYTADAARHIKEMTELAQSQIAGALSVPAAPMTSLLDQQSQHHNSLMKRLQATADTDGSRSEASGSRTRPEEPLSPLDSFSHSDSLPSRRPNLSGGDSSSHLSPSQTSSDPRERRRKEGVEERREKEGVGSSSVEEDIQTAADDSPRSASIPSMLDEKADSTSVATEYSLKFDESMTEDEIEERSFRSLLPSEAHRRGTLKPRPHEESEEEAANHDRTSGSAALTSSKPLEASMAFSGGQDSFSQFTMDMVRQYMKDEEVRLQHQSSLLRLRQKALKEKTRTELAWLEHQRKRLRDKGEDDKMPPIRKKQRGLLMKLQQDQAEIKRLQDANKAARKERQLLLKQQEEIERMRNSTLRLKERLKCAGADEPPETPMAETPASEAASPDTRLADGDARSPSPPLSVSGSETSSIMQKLKKMRSHMDEKHCSPVHYFLSVFTAHHWASLSVCLPNLHPKFQLFIYNQLVRFLTKREQQLMQRRRHAEELLEWKQRLDQEEADVCRMEKEALAVWDRQTPRDRDRKAPERRGKDSSDISSPDSSRHRSPERRTDSEKECVSEGESSVHTDLSGSQAPECPSTAPSASLPESLPASAQHSPAHYASDFTSASPAPSNRSPPAKGSLSTVPSQAEGGGSPKMQLRSPSRTQSQTQSTLTPTASQMEPMSDQSDIESRIRALKEELRKRKSMAYQLKKEQKKRHKERLKAQEASLLKQLDSYNDFIQKTKAELNKEPESTPAAKPQIKAPTSASEKPKIKPPPPHRAETNKTFNMVSDAERTRPDSPVDQDYLTSPGRSRSTSLPEELSDEDPPTVTPTPVYGSPEHSTSGLRSLLSPEGLSRPVSQEAQSQSIQAQPQVFESGANSVVSSHRSEVVDELEVEVGNRSEDHHSEGLLKLDLEEKPSSQQKPFISSKIGELGYSLSSRLEGEDQTKTCKPKAEEVVKSHSSKPHSATVESKSPQYPDYCSSSNDRSYNPDSIAFSKKEALVKDVEASPRSADGYHDDFESSLESSLGEYHQSFKVTSPTSPAHPETRGFREGSRSRSPLYDSQDDEEVEEDIAEELSEHSGTNADSHHSGKLLDLHRDDTKEKNAINSNHSPTISPSQTPPSQARDEMPGFSVGDRVLVSSVQPGTLRFKGPTRFANGFWAGVELDKSEGSNNGTYDGVGYFKCEECHGIFAPPDKITRLPEKFEIYVDTTEDEDSFFGDMSERDRNKGETDGKKPKRQGDLKRQNEETSHRDNLSSRKDSADGTDCPDGHQNNLTTQKENSFLNSQNHRESAHPMANGRDIILEFEDRPTTLLISDMDRIDLGKQSLKEITTLIDEKDIDSHHKSITPPDVSIDIQDVKSPEGEHTDRESLGVFADKLLNNFVKDAVKQFTQIKKAKEQKVVAANQMKVYFLSENVEEEEGVSSVVQKDGLPFFLDTDKEELSSPELCNRPESPVLGASGQEELAKRLAELELSRELLDELGDEQDWFDEDFGLSSRREQQRLKQREEEEEILGGGRSGSSATAALGGEQQAKTPPRPELPLPLPPKLPEQPAMVVPHSAVEVERLVHTATQEIWDTCKLGKDGTLTLAGKPSPKPSEEYLGKEAKGQDQEALCIRSYRQAVYDLTWEILQEIYGEDPSVCQPQWVKPRRASSSYFHRVKTPGDITKVQEFITSEVLKLYGLKKDHNQKTDWQKMLKFGRKKRDRVDHILVQELHEEEAQWVNYDEDELFVKMQLADSIFEALLKDTADVLTQIHDTRAKRAVLS